MARDTCALGDQVRLGNVDDTEAEFYHSVIKVAADTVHVLVGRKVHHVPSKRLTLVTSVGSINYFQVDDLNRD